MEWRYHVCGATHEAILKPSSKAQNSFWIKSRIGEDMGQVPERIAYRVDLYAVKSLRQEKNV